MQKRKLGKMSVFELRLNGLGCVGMSSGMDPRQTKRR